MKIKISMLSCLFIIPVYGQETYTLEQCRTMALQHNVKMKNADNDVLSARQTRKEAFTKYFPAVSATGAGYNANKGLIEMPLSPNMQLSMLKNGIVGGITATQPVFAGGQIVNSNRLAKIGEDVSLLQKEQTENEVSLTVEQYYWQIVVLKEKLNTVTAIEVMLDRLCADVQAAVDAGIKNRNDLLRVQLKKNEVENTRIDLENGLALSKMVLAQYIGADNGDIEVAENVDMNRIPDFPETLRQDHRLSLQLTPEYRLLQKSVDASETQRKLSVGKNLPAVGVGAGYMYDNLMDDDHAFGMVFVSVSIPISDWWGGSYNIKKQKLQLQNAENDLQDKSELLMIKMQEAWNDLEDAYKQIIIARKSIEQATENLKLNDDYYKAGTISMSDLLDAQSIYQQTKDGYIDAYSRYRIKTIEYLQSTGH